MSNNSLVISTTPPLAGLTLVNTVNGALNTLKTCFSGATEPLNPEAHMYWADTGEGWMKQRNASNNGWRYLYSLTSNNMTVKGGTTFEKMGTEGGELRLERPTTTSLSGDVIVDVIGSEVRIFEGAGSQRGYRFDLTKASAADRVAGMSEFGSNLSSNGYQKLPSGLIIQWGTTVISTNSSVQSASITLPIAFTSANLYGICQPADVQSSGSGTRMNADNGTLTTFVFNHSSPIPATATLRWFALGY